MTSPLDELTSMFAERNMFPQSNEIWLGHADTVQLVDECRRLGLVVLGIDLAQGTPEHRWMIAWRDYSSHRYWPGLIYEHNASYITTELAKQDIGLDRFPEDAFAATIVVCPPVDIPPAHESR